MMKSINRISRVWLLGIIALSGSIVAFAQEDKTSLLQNADMEQGAKGWVIDGTQILGKNKKNLSTQTGFYGMGNTVLEAWNGNGTGLADAYIMQRISGLPNGTYVFGAYIGASKQRHRKPVEVTVDGKEVTKYEYWSNRDSVQGVQLFANGEVVRVATNNPDYNSMVCVKNGLYTEGHTAKFNVAITLEEDDEQKSDLFVGLRYNNTNANYVVWDNATLYYFGAMSKEAALDAMAEIDMTNAAAIIDTLITKGYKMNVDSLANLQAVLADVAAKTTTAATLWDDTETLFRAAGKARMSINDYEALKKNIESAKLLLEVEEWSQDWTPDYVDLLEKVVADAEAAYAAAELCRDELTALRKELSWTAGDVHVDSLYAAYDYLTHFVDSIYLQINQAGGVTQSQYDMLENLESVIADTVAAYEDDVELTMEDRTINPNGLLSYIAIIEDAIAEVVANPYDPTAAWSMTLPQSATAIDGYKPLDGSISCDLGYEYTSPLIDFGSQTEMLRLTVTKVSYDQIYFCISSLEFFDAEGNEIPLEASNFYSNADHNTVSGSTDGQSYAGLVDDDPATYFHSDWSGKVTVPHYLEVTLPNGGYTAVSFKMVARAANQRHQFPGEIVLTAPGVRKNYTDLEELVRDAKALEAYSAPEPGFYIADFSYLLDAIAQAEALLADENASETACNEMRKELQKHVNTFKDPETDKSIHLPKAGVKYRIVSGLPGFYEKQFVEKALTVHSDSTLWWENVCADSLKQEFMFEPINPDEDGIPELMVETGTDADGTTWEKIYYYYTIKSVATGLYVDSAFTGIPAKLHLVEQREELDTVALVSLGRGQWNILVKGETLHAGDHNSGTPYESATGPYGGFPGIGSGICSWVTGLDGASAWFIREYPTLPTKVNVSGAQFKSDCIHFEAANTLTLTADRACAFADLALYDLYGNTIEMAEVTVSDNKAIITTPVDIVGCAFAFTNSEGVTSVTFDAKISMLGLLQEAYDEAVAVARVEGTEVMQYADLSEYNAALAKAEEMLASGGSDDEIKAMITELEVAVANLKPNMPVAGKYYFIYSSVEAFEERNGVKMALYSESSSHLRWGLENHLDLNHYWQFEQATAEELVAAGMREDACAFFIKSVATESYIGDINVADGVTTSLTTKSKAMPIVLNSFGGVGGVEVGLDGLGQEGKRIHANGHGSGAGKGGNIVYWGYSAVGSASSWTIVETENRGTKIYDVVVLVEGSGSVSGDGAYPRWKDQAVLNAVPEEGHSFVEWSDGTTANPYIFTLSQDMELKAIFQPNTYRIDFVVDGVTVKTDSIVYGHTIPIPEEPTKEGYTFSGWDKTLTTMPAEDVVISGTFIHLPVPVEHLTILDTEVEFAVEEDMELETITYTRSFGDANWQALYVPFEIPVTEDFLEDFEIADLNDIRQYDHDNNGVKDETVVEAFKVTSGVLEANYPYLIRAKEVGEKSIVVTDATLYATEENSIDCSSEREMFTFTGTYGTLSSDVLPQAEGYYTLDGGVWQPVAEGMSLGAFRFYLKVDSRGGNATMAPSIRMRIVSEDGSEEDGTTGIAHSTLNPQRSTIYDLMGRKVLDTENLQGGIYIVNGKKVVVE